ncbi:related to MAK21 - protein required for 60S ribosomal subunit biogenesis [Ustilago trichophora]|uniref:Related to MAK21 - protein required for 60S ribosomal subunit biogenesis n=1 Tax=Ustilago trichophora TaxID=86804 RepID=A0A5C3E3N5_9BASI|nr:related to MAK21 - protein required for 60S ribosomal subunit biogenesis [Ustilago trichophora]
MARDFRPKGARSPASKPSEHATPAKSSTSFKPATTTTTTTNSPAPAKATPSEAPSTKPTPKKAATPINKKAAYDSDDSADEDTLMREIESFGGSRADLELISKANGKKKSEVQIDEAAFSSEVADFLKQLQANPNSSEPVAFASSFAKKVKEVKPAAAAAAATDSTKQAEAKKQSSQENAKEKSKPKENIKEMNKQNNRQAEAKAKAKAKELAQAQAQKASQQQQQQQQRQSTLPNTVSESTTAQRMGKGKKMVFDDEGVGKETKVKPSHTARGPLRLEAVPQWMSQTLPKIPSTNATNDTLSHDRITQLLDLGADLLREESRAYDDITSSETSLNKAGGSIGTLTASDAQFVRSLLSSEGGGTLSDRISALTLLVQSSPVHNVKHMDNLLNMTRKKSREEASRATRALADWLASEGGLGSRKLRYFRDQPQLAAAAAALSSGDLVAAEAAKSHVLLWAFEDHLKKFYFQFLQILEVQSHDTIPFTRKQATTQIFILLRDKPEQEQNLLRLLVNKLGDPERSVASKTSNHILELLTAHPAMKFIVVREIANLIMRPATVAVTAEDEEAGKTSNHSTHARYYGLLTLNQTVLTTKDEATANHLILLYFELFEGILKANEVKEAKGTAEGEDAEDAPKKKDKKRWKDQPRKGRGKGKGKGKGKQAASAKPEEPKLVKDAESKMVVAILTGVRRAFPFAKMEASVFEKHVNTLFRILHSGSFNISIQALQLIFQLTISNPHQESSTVLTSAAITDRFYRVLYDSLLDPRLEASSKQAMYLNLIFQALKADQEQERVKAFVKRICQILSLHQPSFICGCLHLLGELFKRTPGLRAMLTEPEEDDEEHFQDVASSDDESEDLDKKQAAAAAAVKLSTSHQHASTKYDGRKREPRFAHAGTTCLWDVLPLLSHFHPSVSVHALQLLEGGKISTNADLSLNTLSHFLDRFVYRNPKQKSTLRGASAMQPMVQVGSGVTRSRTHALNEDEFFNTEAFWKKRADAIPADQLFFHKFFNLKSKQPSSSRVQTGGADDDEDALVGSDDEALPVGKDAEMEDGESDSSLDSDDDPDEKEIWKVMKATMPGKEELEGLDDSDVDGDDDEFDYVDSDEEDQPAEAEEEEEDSDDDDGPNVLPGMTFSDEESDSETEAPAVTKSKTKTKSKPAAAAAEPSTNDWEDDSDEGGNVFDEDDDDLLPFTEFNSKKRSAADSSSDEEEVTGGDAKKRKKQADKKRKKSMQNLPTFASAEDYAHLLGGDDDEDV